MPRETLKDLRSEVTRIQGLYANEKGKTTEMSGRLLATQGELADCRERNQLLEHQIQQLHQQHAAEVTTAYEIIADQFGIIESQKAELEHLRCQTMQDTIRIKGFERDYGAISLRTMNLWGQMWNHMATWGGPIGRYAQRYLDKEWENSPEGRKLAAKLTKPPRGKR